MAYTITLTDGAIFATIPDGTINTGSSMVMVGKNYAGYGEFLNQNYIRLLENAACNATSATSFQPTLVPAPLEGQLWYNKTNGVVCVFNGDVWKNVGAVRTSISAPTFNVAGDLWFDSTNQQLKVFNGNAYILVGPASSSGQGTSGAIVTTVQDNLGTQGGHVIIQLFVADIIVGIISKDPTFTPSPAIAGFPTIGPGLQLSTAVSNNTFRGTATNAELLDSLNSSQFLRSDANDTTSGTLGVINDSGFTVGADQDARISVNTVTSEVTLQNNTNVANLSLRVNVAGTPTTGMQINGATGQVLFPAIPTGVPTISSSGNIAAPNFLGNLIGNFSGTVAAPGSNTQVLFNDAGNINAVSGMVFNKSTGSMAVSGNVTSTNYSGSGFITINTAGSALTSIVNGAANAVGNIGSSVSAFNTVFAQTFQGTASNAVFSINAQNVTGTVGIVNGGTGATTRENALNALLPTQTAGVANYYLRTNGSGTVTWEAASGSAGVSSVALSTTLNGLTVSGSPITTSGTLSLAGTLGVPSGGTGRTTLSADNVLIGGGTGAVGFVAPGTNGNVLTAQGGTWISQAPSGGGGSGTVTSVGISTSLNGLSISNSPVTTSGTISIGGTLGVSSGGTGATTASGARTALGLGTIATQNSNNISITGGSMSGVSISGYVDTTNTQSISGAKTFNNLITGGAGFLSTNRSFNFDGSSAIYQNSSNTTEVRIDTLGTNLIAFRRLAGQNGVIVDLVGSNTGIAFDQPTSTFGVGFSGGNGLNFNTFSTTANPGATFTNSNVYKPTGTLFQNTSDERLKTNILNYVKGLSDVINLRPVYYTLLDKKTKKPIGNGVGLIAQEVKQTTMDSMIGEDSEGYYTLDSSELTFALVNAVKELKNEIETLRNEISALKNSQ